MALRDLDAEELSQLAERARRDYEELRAKDLHLDLTRGKPSVEQLDHNERLLSLPGEATTPPPTARTCATTGASTG